MSQIAEYVNYTEKRGEHIKRVEEVYEVIDAVKGQNPKTETKDTNMKTQHTGGDTAGGRCYRVTAVCLLLLCVLLLTAVTVLWIKFNNLNTENNQILTSNNNLTIERDQLQTSYNNLTIERDQLLRERDEYLKTLCGSCKWRCFSFNSSIYYMPNESKSWEESRMDCKDKGADLVIINSKEEQDFIVNQLGSSQVWIGLTDRDKQGEWKWVDGTPVTSTYWFRRIPIDAGGEDCAMIYSSLFGWTWTDNICSLKQNWLCEKRVIQ